MNGNEMEYFIDYHAITGEERDRIFKATLAQSENMLVLLHRLEPGQSQPVHIHVGEDKAYLVLEGNGYFQVGDVFQNAGPGMLVWAPASLPHSVINNSDQQLVLLIVVAPSPGY